MFSHPLSSLRGPPNGGPGTLPSMLSSLYSLYHYAPRAIKNESDTLRVTLATRARVTRRSGATGGSVGPELTLAPVLQ